MKKKNAQPVKNQPSELNQGLLYRIAQIIANAEAAIIAACFIVALLVVGVVL